LIIAIGVRFAKDHQAPLRKSMNKPPCPR